MAWVITTISDLSLRKAAMLEQREKEKLNGALETAEHVCNEIDLPLKRVLKSIQMFPENEMPKLDHIKALRSQALEIGKITRRLTEITHSQPVQNKRDEKQ
jgi:hypothetical protein